MVELLVVVSIIAILSVSAVVGFGYLGDILKAREVTGFLGDVVKQEELKVLRGDFESTTVHFLDNYLVIESYAEDASLELTLGDSVDCADGHNINIPIGGNLTQKDDEGTVMQIKTVLPGTAECIQFADSKQLEWNYELSSGDQQSNLLRFVHFNLKRENLNNPIAVITEVGARVEIVAPYGKKNVYNKSGSLTDSVEITVEDAGGNSQDTFILQ